jgi:26S proteasome regulatory subunit N9
VLQEKIHLAVLQSLIYLPPPRDRTLPLQLIAEETRLPIEEVEHLIMKGFALGLIRGTIDQVDQTVQITWMRGRVLDSEGIRALKERIEEWRLGIKALRRGYYRAGRGIWVK